MPYTNRPSDVFNPKRCDPFADKGKKKSVSSFVNLYRNGGIPCRLQHGSIKHKIVWTRELGTLPYDELLPSVAEGLVELEHPYGFVAKQAFVEMVQAEGSAEKIVPVVRKLVIPLKAALQHADAGVFTAGLEALTCLSNACGPELLPCLKILLPALSKKALNAKWREAVYDALQQIEANTGPESGPIIKAKIPTYTSISGIC